MDNTVTFEVHFYKNNGKFHCDTNIQHINLTCPETEAIVNIVYGCEIVFKKEFKKQYEKYLKEVKNE